MAETVEQYVARILSTLGGREPMEVLRSTPSRLTELVSSLDESTLRWRPQPGKWSIAEQLAHLADAEVVLGGRLRFAAAQPGSTIVAFDQDKWAATGKYAEIPAAASVATFSTVRQWNLTFLDRLDAAAREGYAMHQERGRETLAHMLKLIAGHDINHLNSMQQLAIAAAARVSAKTA